MKLYVFIFCLISLSLNLITSRNGKLYDNQGRQIIFRGPNVVVKVPPYFPITQRFDYESSFNQDDMKLLKSWGCNGIRLGVMWAGVQPNQKGYSKQYLQRMLDLVNLAGKYGIYSLVEFHQDLLSQKFCGDGVPTWIIKKKQSSTFPMPINRKHYKYNVSGTPDYADCLKHPWGLYYFSYDVSYAFNDLYTNKYGLYDKFQNYWIEVAKTFAGNEFVIGYQLINQPFAGSLWKNPAVIVPSMAQRIFLQNFYDKLSVAIRKVDPDHPICFEPVTWDNTVQGGFSHPPGGNRYINQSILCYHFYKPPSLNISSIQARIDDAKRLGISSILSEFSYGNDLSAQAIRIYNTNRQSWFFWAYKTFGKTWGSWQDHQRLSTNQDDTQYGLFYKNGTYIKKYVDLISQTYVQRLSGQYISSSYDETTNDYSISFYTGQSESVLFVNKAINEGRTMVIDWFPKNALLVREYEPGYYSINSIVGVGQRVLLTVTRL